ncbi:hypothetical protein M8J76_008617 [Diaphorina citri]|nr:hypothetical protein M8J75_012979 [Diaphorina citri]KAI5713955.1 hypothetical protein M8J76_008617 [Diaphorina citri]KAI5715949.1 hypothetical protein M8J77_025084 [Diaphorina citri]
MTTTANQQYNTSSSSNNEEDIAAIAKQISDHAEAIYQTWKSRGLAPTEILNHCHSNLNKVDVETPPGGGKVSLGEKPSGPGVKSTNTSVSQSPTQPVMELLSTTPNNNLEQLVSKFVSEDKARLARQQKIYSPKPFTSTIQYALQKFEKKSGIPNAAPSNFISSPLKSQQNSTSPNHNSSDTEPEYPNEYNFGNSTWPLKHQQHLMNSAPDCVDNSSPAILSTSNTQSTISSSPTSTNKYYTLPNNLSNASSDNKLKPSQSKEIPITIVHEGSGTKVNTKPAIISPKPVLDASLYSNSNAPSRRNVPINSSPNSASQRTNPSVNKLSQNKEFKTSMEYLDEVTREEERLINALKTGIVIENNSEGSASGSGPQALIGKSNRMGGPRVDPSGTPTASNVNNIPINRLDTNARSNSVSSVTRSSRTMDTASRRASDSSLGSRTALNAAGTSSSLLSSPIRPFLTRGSVAERVLLFEKCPTELILEKRPKRNSLSGDVHSRIQGPLNTTSLTSSGSLES